MSQVKCTSEKDDFEEGFREEKREHPELSDETVANIVKDHLQADEDYYEVETEKKPKRIQKNADFLKEQNEEEED
jgi:hypothetical protein